MAKVEKDAWIAFVKLTQHFLVNKGAFNYIQLINNLLDKLQKLNIKMSIIVHFLFSHLISFPENILPASDEKGGTFQQVIKVMEIRHQDGWGGHMMAVTVGR